MNCLSYINKITGFAFILLVFLPGCKSPSGDRNDTALNKNEDLTQTDLFIKDRSKYSPEFVEELLEANYDQPIKLIDNYLVIESDTVYIPNVLKLNQTRTFTAQGNDSLYHLTLTRINETTLKYYFDLSNNSKTTLYSDSGNVVLNALFFISEEIDEDDDSGESYQCSEYWKRNDEDCWLSIRLGNTTDEKGKLRAKLSYGCNDISRPFLKLDDCPTLRTNE